MNLAHLCLRTAVVLGFIGFSMGFGMGISQDFSLAPAHAHMNLLGWVSFALYGAFYALIPQAAVGMLPRIHYILASVGTVVMVAGIAGIYLGHGATFEPLAIGGSIAVYGSFILFVFIVFRATRQASLFGKPSVSEEPAEANGAAQGVWG
ncbi:MAG: hypothetical protein JNM20_08890 [Rhizobiales bacterium]|nr:hypothetical protein [Hyphomicrobiales bacterium]